MVLRHKWQTIMIFSTYVEVFPSNKHLTESRRHFLHVCGGVSVKQVILLRNLKFSPRMWRCFRCQKPRSWPPIIFSTYVEVFLASALKSQNHVYFLHVCGGVSKDRYSSTGGLEFSPRMWRCFPVLNKEIFVQGIFSTYVEVFLNLLLPTIQRCNFLHVCGGVSIGISTVWNLVKFSPRMWRCFCC